MKDFVIYCAINIFSKYACIVPLKKKKVLQLITHFKKSWRSLVSHQTKYGQKKVVNFMIDHWNHGYKTTIYKYFQHNKIKFTVAERFIRTLKNKTCKYVASISKKCVCW